MNILTDPQHLKNLMKNLGLKPKDYLRQNFLIDEEVISEIIRAASIAKNETIIEIGPGLGVLTQALAKASGRVVAIEKDRTFVPVLKNFFHDSPNVEIVEQDVLQFNFEAITGDYKVVANIPYYLTAHLLQNLLALKHKPQRMVLMVQKEVGERLVATAGELSVLGISVQVFADVSIALAVPRQLFWPRPKVDSCVVVIEPKNKYPQIKNQKLFFRLLKIAFAGKRKQIHNTLANGLTIPKEQVSALLTEAGIDPSLRPQDLSIEKWISLYRVVENKDLHSA